jgi:uncharacterized membrane protein
MTWLVYALFAMFFQGLVLFLVKLFSSNVHPITILFFQYVGSLISITIYLFYKRISFKLPRKYVVFVFVSSFLVSTGLALYYLAIGLQNASIVVPVHNVGITVLPAILAYTLLKEKVTRRSLLGIACSVICILVLTL